MDYIPAGYTCVIQPVNVGVNAPFKSALHDYNHAWKMINYHGVTNVDKFPTPEREDLYPWIINAFNQITSESIVRTFQHIGFLESNDEIDETDTPGMVDDDLSMLILQRSSKLTKTPGNKFYQCYIKIRIHSIDKFCIARISIQYANFNRCQLYMIQNSLFTKSKEKTDNLQFYALHAIGRFAVP